MSLLLVFRLRYTAREPCTGQIGTRFRRKGTRLEPQAVFLFARAVYREEVHGSHAQYITQYTPLIASRGALPPSKAGNNRYAVSLRSIPPPTSPSIGARAQPT